MDKMMMIIIFNILSVLCFLPCGLVADPDTLQDFCVADVSSSLRVNGYPCEAEKATKSADFFSSVLRKGGNTDNPNGSNATEMGASAFPGLNNQGVSTNRVDFAVGGINPPHVHPRASEVGRVEKGQLYLGILDTHNNFYSKTLQAGDSFIIPRGLLHFQYNVGNGEATQIVSFNSQDPGIVFVIQTLFGSAPEIPTDILATAFRTDKATIEYLKSGFSNNADSSRRATS